MECSHSGHHSDTLFLISEDDWRLKESEDVKPDRKLPKRGVWADPDEPHDSDDDWGCWLAPGRVDRKQSGGGEHRLSHTPPVVLGPGRQAIPRPRAEATQICRDGLGICNPRRWISTRERRDREIRPRTFPRRSRTS